MVPAPIIIPPPRLHLPAKFDSDSRPTKSWMVISGLDHGAAAYDAWSTRRAIASGRVEADPLMAPFAHSSAIYGAIQVIPLCFDYLGRRLQRDKGWKHRVWWVPQALATATYLFSGSYNVIHTR